MDKLDQQQIITTLKALDIPHRIVQHPPVFSVADSVGVAPEKYPVKNLFLVERNGPRKLLVIMDGLARLDVKGLAADLGTAKLHFGNENTLRQHMGVAPGSVSLFCLLHPGSQDVEVVVQKQLLSQPELGFHPGDNTATVFIPGASIERFVAGVGREPVFVSM